MSMMDRARNLVLASRERVERATGRALGDGDMPVKEQVEELRGHLKTVGKKVLKTTGRALGDEEMAIKDQVEELKVHLKVTRRKVRDALHKNEGPSDT